MERPRDLMILVSVHGFGQFRLISDLGTKYRLRTSLRNRTTETRVSPAVTAVDVGLSIVRASMFIF